MVPAIMCREEVSFLTRYDDGGPSLCHTKVSATEQKAEVQLIQPCISLVRGRLSTCANCHLHSERILPGLVSRLTGHQHVTVALTLE